MTEPTKAPWHWVDPREHEGGSGDASALRHPGDPAPSVLFGADGIEWWKAADARLIEKAPEMLALLRDAPVTVRDLLGSPAPVVAWATKVDALVAYILGEPTREEEEASTDGS